MDKKVKNNVRILLHNVIKYIEKSIKPSYTHVTSTLIISLYFFNVMSSSAVNCFTGKPKGRTNLKIYLGKMRICNSTHFTLTHSYEVTLTTTGFV